MPSTSLLDLDDLQVEALEFAAGDESLESMTVGQGLTEVGASFFIVLSCTIPCCCT